MKEDQEVIGIITLKGMGNTGKLERRQVAQWLRKQADDLEEYGDNYATLYRARKWGYVNRRSTSGKG